MKYWEYQFLELFDEKKVLDEDISEAIYYYFFLDDLIFQFHVSPFEDYASITLLHKKSDLYLIKKAIYT